MGLEVAVLTLTKFDWGAVRLGAAAIIVGLMGYGCARFGDLIAGSVAAATCLVLVAFEQIWGRA